MESSMYQFFGNHLLCLTSDCKLNELWKNKYLIIYENDQYILLYKIALF